MLVGHEDLRESLSGDLPAVVLIEGPEGIGKRMVAREVGSRVAGGVNSTEVGRTICTSLVSGTRHEDHLESCQTTTASVARAIRDDLTVRRRGSRVILLDAGRATEDAANVLLKTLEEPPPNVHFVMWASQRPLETIRSRAERYVARPLGDDQVRNICLAAGVSESRCDRATALAAGRPGRALEMAAMMDCASTVTQLVRAAVRDDPVLLSNLCAGLAPSSAEDFEEARRTGDTERGRRTRQLCRVALIEARTGEHRLTRRDEMAELAELGPRLDPIIARASVEGPGSLVMRQVALSIRSTVRLTRR